MNIFVVADYFTKFMEIFPIPNMDTETVRNVIFKRYIKRYGFTYALHKDQADNLKVNFFKTCFHYLEFIKPVQLRFTQDQMEW